MRSLARRWIIFTACIAIIISAIAIFLFLPFYSSGKTGHPRWKYIIHIVVDNLSYEYLGCYGSGFDATPFIDRLAGESLVFDNAVCQKVFTLPSLISVLTSTYPITNGIRSNGLSGINCPFVSLPELLSRNGYDCLFLASENEGSLISGIAALFGQGSCLLGDESGDEDILTGVLSRLRERKGEKVYLMMVFNETHRFWQALEGAERQTHPYYRYFLSKYEEGLFNSSRWSIPGISLESAKKASAMYSAKARVTDERVKRLVDGLKEEGMWDDTVIILHSDHGGIMRTLQDTSVKVPLIMRIPGMKHSRINEQVELIDIAPTVLDMLGLSFNGRMHPRSEGESLAGLLGGSLLYRHRKYAFSEGPGGLFAIRTNKRKLIFHPDLADEFTKWDQELTKSTWITMDRVSFFDLENDPYEMTDLYREERFSAEAMSMRDALLAWYKIKRARGYDFFHGLSIGVRDMLKERGYGY